MNAYDLFVISFYLGLLVYIGYKSSIKLNTFSNFTIGSKTSPWWAIGLSVMATYVSALSFLGGPAWAYNTGMSAPHDTCKLSIGNFCLCSFLYSTFIQE